MSAKIYHAKKLWDGFSEPPHFPSDYEFVAEVPNATTPDEAFVLTNTIDSPWTQSGQVRAVRSQIRSTSVGDVVVIDDVVYRCEFVGWEVLSK